MILERDAELGGILNQCIHNGFGLHRFGQQLTGPEYAGRYIEMLRTTGVRVELGTMVLEVTPDKQVHCVSRSKGYQIIQAKSIILCMGCRERTRGAIGTPGTRPAGIYTAGAAQRYVNMEGYLVGRRVLILGSGDIGLIMARRMTLEGAKVLACVEVMPYSGGLTRNIVQCLQDFDIPLYLSHTIVEIQGKKRVEKAIVAKVDENRRPIPGTEMEFDVDTILLSVGLIPENELTRQAGIAMDPHTKGAVVYENMETEIPGVFACGNVVHVHDLVDFVSGESETAGAAAAAAVCVRVQPSVFHGIAAAPRDGIGAVAPCFLPGGADSAADAAAQLAGQGIAAAVLALPGRCCCALIEDAPGRLKYCARDDRRVVLAHDDIILLPMVIFFLVRQIVRGFSLRSQSALPAGQAACPR